MGFRFDLRRYRTASGHVPLTEWLLRLDGKTAGRIGAHVDRMRTGNFGDSRSVGHGVLELRIHAGPGYRVYYLRDGKAIVILLCGGDKSTQSADIIRARLAAEDYRRRR